MRLIKNLIIVGEHMNDLIFSIYTSVTDTTKKRTHNQEQFKKYFTRLRDGLKDYASVCNADFTNSILIKWLPICCLLMILMND